MILHFPFHLTLSDAGVWRLNLGRGGMESAPSPPPIWGTFSTWDPKNGSQPQNSPRLRYYNTKRTQKLCETCRNRHLSVSWILPSFCSRQGPPLWNWANFDHFCPLPARPNVIWLQKVVSYTPFTYLGKVKKNWQLFPLIFFGESPKYDRGGGFRPPPAPNRVKKCPYEKLSLHSAHTGSGSPLLQPSPHKSLDP